MLNLRGVSYRYPGARIETLHGIDLDLREGTITGLVGPAEAGKSTLCLVAGGLAPRVVGGRLSGQVGIDLESIADWPMHRLAEAVVTGVQDPAGQLTLIAETVAEEVAFGPANLGLPRAEIDERVEAALRATGIEELAGRDPSKLSGGQQQLVVLAGLLAMRARHLVLDEPLAHLDAAGARLVLDAVRAAADGGTAVLLAEQRTAELATVADAMVVMGAGNIIARGTPREVLSDRGNAILGVAEPPEVALRRKLV
ncbi:MAG: ABC transporter ATP-binding protein, partial [Candidatus Limnocylindrales bacterium]